VHRYAKHEVERFGQLIPMGGLVICSVAAANRDPKIFNEPDRFDITRKDLAYREPRGQFRIDGLPAGVVPGLGAPATLPPDSPSTYGLTAYAAMIAAKSVLLGSNHFQLAETHDHTIAARWPEDARVCRRLLVKRGA
jgi:pulcherriminic acid synthase